MPGTLFPQRATLRREIHAAHEVLEARVGPQGVEGRIDLQKGHVTLVHLVGFFQPLEGPVPFAQPGIDQRYFVGPDLML